MTPTVSPAFRVAVLISGRGSNLQALIEHFRPADARASGAPATPHAVPDPDGCRAGSPPAGPVDGSAASPPAIDFVGVLSNRPTAGGLDLARAAGIPTAVVDHRTQPSREAFDQAVHDVLIGWSPDLVVLAGFMRILTPGFVDAWAGRLVNVHPSLLPALRGLETHARALAAGLPYHGCSIHLVTAELDAGPVLARAIVPVRAGDTPETLARRVQYAEHQLYPTVVASMASRGAASVQPIRGTLERRCALPDAPEEYWFDEHTRRLVPCPDDLRDAVQRVYAELRADA